MGANIPLPALAVNTNYPNPLDEYMRAAQLKSTIQGQQLQQGQIEQQQYQLQDQRTLRSLAPKFVQKDDKGNVTGYDHDGLINAATQAGVNPSTLMKMEQERAEMRDKLATASGKELDAHDKANDQLFQLMEGVRSAAAQHPEAAQAAWQNALPRARQLGAPVDSLPAQFPTQNADDFVNGIESSLALHKQVIADAKQKQELEHTKAQTAEATAGATQKTAEGQKAQAQADALKQFGGLTPEMIEAKYVAESQKPQGQRDQKFLDAVKAYKSIVPAVNFNLQNSGASADSGGNPSEIAQAIANGSMAWKDAVSPRTPMSTKNAILKQVFKVNPNFDTAEFGLEADAAKKARSGAWADTRLAYNTALDHADLLLDASKALNNGDTRALNALENKFKTAFGWDKQITFDAIANAYNHEVGSVVSKGHITDKEVETGHATLPDDANQKTIASVVGAYKGLMTSKRDELDKIIKAGAGNKANAILKTGSTSDQGGDFFSKFGGKAKPQ